MRSLAEEMLYPSLVLAGDRGAHVVLALENQALQRKMPIRYPGICYSLGIRDHPLCANLAPMMAWQNDCVGNNCVCIVRATMCADNARLTRPHRVCSGLESLLGRLSVPDDAGDQPKI